MLSKVYASFAILVGGAQLCAAQTPPDIVGTPALNQTVGVAFNATNGTIDVTPGIMIPIADAANEPTISYANATGNDTFMVVMIDYSLPTSIYPNDTDLTTLLPGIGVNRTTRLHWWQGNFTLVSTLAAGNGTNTSSTGGALTGALAADLGPYQGPAPPANDSAHIYAIFLFNQPDNFTFTPTLVGGNGSTVDLIGVPRANFSLSLVTEQTGDPIAANYFLTARNTTVVGNSTVL